MVLGIRQSTHLRILDLTILVLAMHDLKTARNEHILDVRPYKSTNVSSFKNLDDPFLEELSIL